MKLRPNSIDASSIADIAFLLLAFIILSTTLESEEGIPAKLPEKNSVDDPIPIVKNERDVLEIYVNKANEIMIEGEQDKFLSDVNLSVMEFLTNKQNGENLPKLDLVNEITCKANIGRLIGLETHGKFIDKNDLKLWEERYEAFKLIGEFKTVNKEATIGLEYDATARYGTYLSVRDELMNGINQLRNHLCLDKFGVSFTELSAKREAVRTAEDIARIKAVRTVYPQRIIKKKV
ncbi:MAG: biopolymer transporter ExbD [Flavobacteriales bacterium]